MSEEAPVRSFDSTWHGVRPPAFFLSPVVVLSASYQCAISGDRSVSKKQEGARPFSSEIAEKVLNNTVREKKMVRYGDASYGTAVDLVKYGPRFKRTP